VDDQAVVANEGEGSFVARLAGRDRRPGGDDVGRGTGPAGAGPDLLAGRCASVAELLLRCTETAHLSLAAAPAAGAPAQAVAARVLLAAAARRAAADRVALYVDPPGDDGDGSDEHHDSGAAHREPSLIRDHTAPCAPRPVAWLIL